MSKIIKFVTDSEIEMTGLTNRLTLKESFKTYDKLGVKAVFDLGENIYYIVFANGTTSLVNRAKNNFKIYNVKSAKEFYSDLARSFIAYNNCITKDSDRWENIHKTVIYDMVKRFLPSGSGFDKGTQFLFDESNDQKLVFQADYHYMNDDGFYIGWESHKVIVKPNLAFGIDISITGRNRRDNKEYIHSCFADFDYLVEINSI
jgi:hypothetical protein